MGRFLSLVVAALLGVPAVATGAPVPLDPDPLERGIAVAAPAVYRLDVTVDIAALEHNGGRLRLSPEAGRVTTTGTAFGIAAGGWLAAADHVVGGDGEAAAVSAYQQHLRERGRPASREAARSWVAIQDAAPSGIRVVSRSIAQSDGGMAWEPTVVARRPGTDLALLRISREGAPALDLRDARTRGTPVSVLSYRGDAGAPTALVARRGTLGRTGTAPTTRPPGALRTIVEAEIDRGDSGAPVVDADGRVRGMVVALSRGGGGTIEPAERIRALLGDRAAPGEAALTTAWRAGLAALWELDFPAAGGAMARITARSPDHADAAVEAQRAEALTGSAVAVRGQSRLFRLFIALALIGAVGAAVAAVGLLSLATRREPLSVAAADPFPTRPPTEV